MVQVNKIYNMPFEEGMKLIEDESIDLIITDPPYNTGLNSMGGGSKGKGWLNNFFDDSYTTEEYANLITNASTEMFRVLKNNKACYVFINWKELGNWINGLKMAGFKIKNVIVWDKVIHGLNYQNYAYTYELIIFAVKGDFFPHNKNIADKKDGLYKDVWRIQREVNNEQSSVHETIKPFEVILPIIRHASEDHDLILDLFVGSGSIPVASKLLNRRYLGFEIDETYIKYANERLQQENLRCFL